MRINDYLPLVSPPAVEKDGSGIRQVDGFAVLGRALPVGGVVWAAVHAIDAASMFIAGSSLISYPGFSGFAASAIAGVIEYGRAQDASYEANIEEYINAEEPKAKLFRYIVENPFAVRDLIHRDADLSKLDEKGRSLLFYASSERYGFDLEVFDLLFKTMPLSSKSSKSSKEKFNCICDFAESRPEMLEYLIEKKLISASDLTTKQQKSLSLLDVPNESADLLKELGCCPK